MSILLQADYSTFANNINNNEIKLRYRLQLDIKFSFTDTYTSTDVIVDTGAKYTVIKLENDTFTSYKMQNIIRQYGNECKSIGGFTKSDDILCYRAPVDGINLSNGEDSSDNIIFPNSSIWITNDIWTSESVIGMDLLHFIDMNYYSYDSTLELIPTDNFYKLCDAVNNGLEVFRYPEAHNYETLYNEGYLV